MPTAGLGAGSIPSGAKSASPSSSYDGGTISVCRGKKNCTKQDVADWFGIQIDPIPGWAVPESAPLAIMKGSIKAS
jgi:hypothetical protein